MTLITSIILGLVQGLTEFLPISSSGHLILARTFLNIPLDNTLTFDIFLNTATLLAVVYCFWGEIKRIFIDLRSQGLSSRSTKLLTAIVIGTIPAALVGFKYGSSIENTFRNPSSVAWALIAGSVLMYFGDKVNKSSGNQGGISLLKSFVIGVFQTLALIPGISRSGATISGGLLSKLSREEAIRFSFLLYIPVSLGALLKAILDISKAGTVAGSSPLSFSSFIDFPHIAGFIVAFTSGLWAVRFMIRYLSNHSFKPFIYYRIALAILIFILL